MRPLLSPRSVALIGASGRAGSLGRIVYENLLDAEFSGELFAVNPKHLKVLGRRSYPSIAAIEHTIDLAVICTPPDAVSTVIRDCAGRVHAAVVLTAAPSADANAYHRWRENVTASARVAKVRMLGPASFGIARTAIGLNATAGAVAPLRGRLTLISQSGAVASALLDFAREACIGFASVAGLGVAADVDFGETLEFALADPETDGIVVYVETLRDARAFLSALRAAARVKPVIVLKSGRTAKGSAELRPAPDRVFEAALKRAGTVRVHTYTQLFAAAAILAAGRIPHGNQLTIVSNGRGPGLMAADRAADAGVALAELRDEARTALAALLPHERALENPVDIDSEATPSHFAAAVRVLLAEPHVDAVLCLHVATPAAPATDAARAVASVAHGAPKPVLAAWLGSVERTEARSALEAGGVVNFYTPENAVDAFSFLAAYRRNQEWLLEVPPPLPELGEPDIAAALRVRSRVLAESRTRLRADEARTLLAAFGIAASPCAVARSARGAQSAARRIGYPVALQSEDAGPGAAPYANLRNAAMVRRAFSQLRAAAQSDAAKRTVVVRADPSPSLAGALRIGVYTDAVFGPVVACGAATAAACELALMLPPLNRRLALDLIDVAIGNRLPPGAVDSLIALLLRVSAMVCSAPWLIELSLAPVLITAEEATVLSAIATIDRRRPVQPDGYRHMAIHPYPAELDTALKLKNGAELRVRPIRPEDAALERAFVAGLSDQSRYLRFMQHLQGLTPQMLARFTQVDYDRELALVALDGADGAQSIVAAARYVANWDRESAEFAIVVADAWHGRGLGYALMQMLIRCARKRGFTRLIGVVLGINAGMLALAAALGFVASRDPNDPEQVIVTLELGQRNA